jgi:hypothetical protein
MYAKEPECIYDLSSRCEKGLPYPGAKEHYIVDIDDNELLHSLMMELEKMVPVPIERRTRRLNG